jgi:hypothetical protein
MQNETGSAAGTAGIDTHGLEAEVRSAVEQSVDVQDTVRRLILEKISTHTLDLNGLREVTHAVLDGARAGLQKGWHESAAHTERARTSLQQTVLGLDTALAQVAQASKLAMQEASGRLQQFSKEDLVRARTDLESLEAMFLDTLQSSATATKDAAGELLSELAAHARVQGSAVGAQVKDTLTLMTEQLGTAVQAQMQAGVQLAQATSDWMRQIAAGVLGGLAERVKPGPPAGPPAGPSTDKAS